MQMTVQMTGHALIIEDSRAMRTVLTRVLTGLSLTVDAVGDARAATHCLDHGRRPDLVLVDHNLPGQSGLQFVSALRARPGPGGIKVLMVSAEGHSAFIAQALGKGIDEFLFKPFTTDALISKIEMLGVVHPRLQTALAASAERTTRTPPPP